MPEKKVAATALGNDEAIALFSHIPFDEAELCRFQFAGDRRLTNASGRSLQVGKTINEVRSQVAYFVNELSEQVVCFINHHKPRAQIRDRLSAYYDQYNNVYARVGFA